MQRRLYLAPLRRDQPRAQLLAHWRERHAEIFAATPLLLGYVQNRFVGPTDGLWTRVVCSETWFASQADERTAFTSAYYVGTVAADEDRFLDRQRGWAPRVVARRPLTTTAPTASSPSWRVLALGAPHDVPLPRDVDCHAEVLDLDRPAPPWAEPTWDEDTVLSIRVASRAEAERVAADLGPLAVVAQPAAIIPPPRGLA